MQNDKQNGSRIEEGELRLEIRFIFTKRCKMIKKTAAGLRKGCSVLRFALFLQKHAK
jgi:hypothetical protein